MMFRTTLISLLLIPIAGFASAQERREGWTVTRFSLHRRVVVRVPRVTSGTPVEWREKKGPKCVAVDQMAGALVHADGADLVLLGGDRVRVKLDGDCPALGYYSGFYLKPAADGMVCAGRDTIRSRAGDSCRIKALKRLTPKR